MRCGAGSGSRAERAPQRRPRPGPLRAGPRPWRHCGAGRAPRPRLHIGGAAAAAQHKMEAAGLAPPLGSGAGGASVELCNVSGSPSDSLKGETVLPTKGSLGGLAAALSSPARGVLQNGVCSRAVSAEREAASFGWSRVEVTLRDFLCRRDCC